MGQISDEKEREKNGEILRFRNYYECSECGTEWTDDWSATCDDRCPKCDTSCSPSKSEDLTVKEAKV